jgi:hypothetical protein
MDRRIETTAQFQSKGVFMDLCLLELQLGAGVLRGNFVARPLRIEPELPSRDR